MKKYTKDTIVTELKAQIAEYKKIWRHNNGEFIELKHVRRHKVISELLEIIDEMTDRELYNIQNRVVLKQQTPPTPFLAF